MSELRFSRLGPLYAKLGLQTAPDVVNARLSGAANAYQYYDDYHVERLVRGALGLSAKDELDGLATKLREADPTMGLDNDDREVGLVASGLLHEKMSENTPEGYFASLVLATASCGGLRQSELDDGLVVYSEQVLLKAQSSKNVIPSALGYKAKPKQDKKWAELEDVAKDNQYQSVHDGLKAIVDASFSYTETSSRHIQGQLTKIINHQKLLDEQMQIHWWAVGLTSITSGHQFENLDPYEAAFHAALDLACLTTSTYGQSAASPLLGLVLQSKETNDGNRKLSDIVKNLPDAYRKPSVEGVLDDEEWGSLAPVHLAVALSIDENDQKVWHGRFGRRTGMDANLILSPNMFALQFYREVLLRRQVKDMGE